MSLRIQYMFIPSRFMFLFQTFNSQGDNFHYGVQTCALPSSVTIHREYTISNDDAEALCLSLLQALLELCHVCVSIAVALCLTKTYTVDDRCVVEGVRDDSILSCEQRLEYTTVSIEASSVEDSILSAEVVSDSLLQLLVNILAAADETY